MSKINTVEFEGENLSALKQLLQEKFLSKRKIILVDKNTEKFCLPILLEQISELEEAEVLVVANGENSKSMETCFVLWKKLTDLNINRGDLLINLGGGMVSDLGGFVAASYKRGMSYINIPTTLLAQVDASIGGKTGVNFHHLKNLIGSIYLPENVFIYPGFLKTLPHRQVLSGFAEVIKSGLISDEILWRKITNLDGISPETIDDLIEDSCNVKLNIVQSDLLEKNVRKTLNFGHTIGHAIETHSMQNHSNPCFHGEAIAMGMISESYISFQRDQISQRELEEIVSFLIKHYDKIEFEKSDYPSLLNTMKKDKKNTSSAYNFSLLNKIGDASFDDEVDEDLIKDSLEYLLQMEF